MNHSHKTLWLSRLWRELNRKERKGRQDFKGFALFAPFAVRLSPANPVESTLLTTKTRRHQVIFVPLCLGGKTLSILCIILLAALLAGCSLSAPPPSRGRAPILTPLPPQPDVTVELPSRRPSIANGAAIYAEKCAACHGASGKGDGDRAGAIQSRFGAMPADLTADSVARASTLAEWYAVVTGGRLERGMPFFSESLSVDDRWDVIAYAWSLGSPQEVIASGKTIYEERCVQCHGETGKGDGPQAGGPLPDLSNLAGYTDVAPGEWDNALDSTHVPSFSGKLSSEERRAVDDYIRSFAYDAAAVAAGPTEPAPAPNATRVPEPAGIGLTIDGSIINGTNGGPQPGNLEGTFYYLPGGLDQNNQPVNEPVTQTIRADAQGRFTVPGLQAQAGDVIAANVQYGDIPYWSDLITVDGLTTTIDMPIHVYEQTTATDALQIDTLHVRVTQDSGVLSVVEFYGVSNLGDRTVANMSGGPALRFNLPAGATAFLGMTTVPGVYAQSDGGFEYFEAIPPGDNTANVQITYQLPADADASLDRGLTYPVNSIVLLAQTGDLKPAADQLIEQSPTLLQGQTYQVFAGGPLSTGQSLTFRLTRSGTTIDAKLIGGIAILIAGAGVIGYGFWRMRAPKAPPVEREALLDQIAALDDAFDAGQIAESEYRKQREALKAKAVHLMRDE